MRIRKAKLLPRDEVGWISRNRLDSGRCLSLFLDIPFYRTQNPQQGIVSEIRILQQLLNRFLVIDLRIVTVQSRLNELDE